MDDDKDDILNEIINSKINSDNNDNKININNSKNEEEEIIEEDLSFDNYDDNSENEKNEDNNKNKENKENIKIEKNENKKISLENIEVDKAINTENIQEINDLINSNKELNNEKVIISLENESKEEKINKNIEYKKEHDNRELINELIEKDKLLELLIKSNSELKSKIEYSNKKFEDISKKIEEQEKEKADAKDLQIKNIEKEIKLCNTENENYKKRIEKMKNNIQIKEKLEKDSNIKILLQKEKNKNKELKSKLSNLKNINMAQLKYINDYDKENHISEKVEMFKKEIEKVKNSIKEDQEKYLKLERFNKAIHEKIIGIEIMVKNLKEKKKPVEEKSFSQEEFYDTLDIITNLKKQVIQKRKDLNNITKNNEEALYKKLSENKKIELEIKENIRMNKLLIFQRNELRRIIKAMINN